MPTDRSAASKLKTAVGAEFRIEPRNWRCDPDPEMTWTALKAAARESPLMQVLADRPNADTRRPSEASARLQGPKLSTDPSTIFAGDSA